MASVPEDMSLTMQHGYFLPACHGFPSYSAQTYSQIWYQSHINHLNMNILPGLGDSMSGPSLAVSERWKYFGRYSSGNPAMSLMPSSHPNSPVMLQGQGQQFPTSQSLVNYMLNSSMYHPAPYYGDPRAGSRLPQQLLQSLMQFSHQRFSKQGQVCDIPSASPTQEKPTSQYQPPRSVPQSLFTSTYNGALGYGSDLFPHSFRDLLPSQHPSYNERAAQLDGKQRSAETFKGARHQDDHNEQSADSMQFSVSAEFNHAQLQSSLPRATPLPSSESVTELYHNRMTAETLTGARQQSNSSNKQPAGSIKSSVSVEHDHGQAQSLALPSGQCQHNGYKVSVEYQHGFTKRPGHPCYQTFNETSNSQEVSSGSALGNHLYSKVALKTKKAKSMHSPSLPKKQQRKSRRDLRSEIRQDQDRQPEHFLQASQTVYPVRHLSLVSGAQNTGVNSTNTDKRGSEDFLAPVLRKLLSSAENCSTESRSLFRSALYNRSANELSRTSDMHRLAEGSQEGRTSGSGNFHCGVDDSQWAQAGRGASGGKDHLAMNTENRTMLQTANPLLQKLLDENRPRLYERLHQTVESHPILQTLIDKESSRSRKHLRPKIKRLLGISNKSKDFLTSKNTAISSQTQLSNMNTSTDERSVPTGTELLQKSCQCARYPITCDLHNPLGSLVQREEDMLSVSDPSLTPVQQQESENAPSDNRSDDNELVQALLERDVDIMKRTYESSDAHELDSQQINPYGKLPQQVSGLDHVNSHTALKHSESDIQITDHTAIVIPSDKYQQDTVQTSAEIVGGSSPESLGRKALDMYHTCLACKQTFGNTSQLEEHLFMHLESNANVSVDREHDGLFQDDGMDSEHHPAHLRPEPTEQATSFPLGTEQVAVANETLKNSVDDLTNETPENGVVVKFEDVTEESVCRLYDPESEENGQEVNVQNEGKQILCVAVGCQDDIVSAKQMLLSPVSDSEETPNQPRPTPDSRKWLLTEKTKGNHNCFVISEHSVDVEKHVCPPSPQNLQESKTSEFSHSKVSALKMTRTSKTKTGLKKGKLKSSDNSHLKLSGQTTMPQESCQSSYAKKIGKSVHCPDKTLISKTSVLGTLKTAPDGTLRIEPARKEKSVVEKHRAEGQCSYPVQCAVEEIRSGDRESSSSPADSQELRLEITEPACSDVLLVSTKKKPRLKKRKLEIISDQNGHSMKKLNRPYKPVSVIHERHNAVASSVSGEKQTFGSSKHQPDTKDSSEMRSLEVFRERRMAFPIKHTAQTNSTQGSARTNHTYNLKKGKIEHHTYKRKAQRGHEVLDMDSVPSKKSKVDGEDKRVHVVDDLKERKRDMKCSDTVNSCRKKDSCSRSPNLCGNKVQNKFRTSSTSDDSRTDHSELIDSSRLVATSNKAKKIVNSLKNLFKNNLHLQSHCMRQGKSGAKDATCVKDSIQESRYSAPQEILETQHVMNEWRNETHWLKENAENSVSDIALSWKENTDNPENTTGICEIVIDFGHKGRKVESVSASPEPVADSVQVCGDHCLKNSVSSVSGDKSSGQGVNDNSLSTLTGDKSSGQGVNDNSLSTLPDDKSSAPGVSNSVAHVSSLSSSKSLSQGVKDNSVSSLSGDRSSNQDMDNSVNRVPGEKSSNESVNDNKDFIFCIKCMTMFTKRLVYNEHGCCQKNQNQESNEKEMDDVASEQDCADFGESMFDHKHKEDAAQTNPSVCIELDGDSGLSDVVCADDAECNQEQKSARFESKSLSKIRRKKNRKPITSSQKKKKPMVQRSKSNETSASGLVMFKCEHCDQNYSSHGGLLFHWQAVHRKSVG